MTDKEAMNLALEALMYASYEDIEYNDACAAKVLEARNALKERLAQPHETTLKEFNQLILDDPKYHIWAKEKEALADPMREVQRLGQEIEKEPVACERCKQLEEHAYDLVGKLRVANIKLSMNKEQNT